MEFSKMKCCAIQELHGIGSYSNAFEMMKAFCKGTISGRVMFGSDPAMGNHLYSFYLFTGAVYKYKSDWSPRNYGKELRDFILANGLGEVWESPEKVNLSWHPDHSNQVWVWSPDEQAVKKWWSEVCAKEKLAKLAKEKSNARAK